GFRLQASGFRLQASGFRLQASGFRLQAWKNPLPAQSAIRNRTRRLPIPFAAVIPFPATSAVKQ
ncbi:hypothetical protein ACFFUC_05115, partial [Paracoccus cavernae]|uniref:hypothetical protein n=1 Tax=Paracoccus cavernae TaxID=1571207 RepID=UPI0035F45BEF